MQVRGGMVRHVVVDTDLGYDAIMKEIEILSESTLLVGIQEKAKTKSQSKGGRSQKAGDSVAEYAAKNEFGDSKTPERSFIRSSFDQNINRIENITADQYGKVIDRQMSLQNALGNIGQVMVGLIKTKIRSIQSPPNSPATIAIKKSSKPLIDFGQMFASVTYAIRTKK